MKIRHSMTRLTIALALVALVATGAVWEVRRAFAFNPQPDPPGFGMVSLTHEQTMRVNVVNLSNPPEPDRGQSPPDPCRVLLTFRNAQGQPITNGDGQVIRRNVVLQAGESAFLDLNGAQFGTVGDTNLPTRTPLRPFVRVSQGPKPDLKNGTPPDPCFATMEVFDNATGRTSLFIAGSPRLVDPPEPDRQQ
jgi:hypothetical protein